MNTLTAKRLRILLFGFMVVIIVAIAGGFLLVQRSLQGYATDISKLNADANSGDQNIRTLVQLEERLRDESSTIESARSVVADNATYSDRVINDISKIASQSGVSITSLEFSQDAATSPGSPTPTPPPTAGMTPTLASPAPQGVTKKTVTVAVESPVRYSNLMNFIQGIESNDLKMQLTSVSLTKDKGDTVATQTFSIEVYVRQ